MISLKGVKYLEVWGNKIFRFEYLGRQTLTVRHVAQ